MEVIKGRMYDYNNGRFLSVDPFIQNPTSTQSMNPYTYIFNNPLSGVDPTGYRVHCVLRCNDGGIYVNTLSDGTTIVVAPPDSGIVNADGSYKSLEEVISDLNNIMIQSHISTDASIDSQEGLRVQALNNTQPKASPLPITTVTSKGQTVNLIYGVDGIWHHVGNDWLSNVHNQFIVDSSGIAHAIPEKGLVAVDAEIFEYGSYAVGGAGALKVGYGAIKSGLRNRALLSQAREARDVLSESLSTLSNSKRPATVTAGYNVKTGEVVAQACGGGKCAEDNVLAALGGNKKHVKFTEATRPRHYGKANQEVPVCPTCELKYGRDVFPEGTLFKNDL